MNRTRSQFTPGSLFGLTRDCFHQLTQGVLGGGRSEGGSNGSSERQKKISLVDCLLSALAVFSLKYASLLQFDKEASSTESALRHNLRALFGVDRAPCDTSMRERLDGVELGVVRGAMKAVLARLQRGKVLEQWKFLGRYFLISLDGSGFFSSANIHCNQCCEKHHRNGTITYSHQMVVGSVVCPGLRQVLPIGFEPIVKKDGEKKNDCERKASKRWLENFRKDHPQLPTVIVADGLSSNDPFIENLEKNRCSYILVCKNDDHKYLWNWFWAAEKVDVTEFEETIDHTHKRYRFMKNVPLNESSQRLVTVVHYHETRPDGKTYACGWITDLEVTHKNVRDIVKGGRARWKIENETFNTLKNQGYEFEHNFGHGFKTLSNLLAGLMLLAFLIDQSLEAVNLDFKKALQKLKQRCYLWETIRSSVKMILFKAWDDVYASILDPPVFSLESAIRRS